MKIWRLRCEVPYVSDEIVGHWLHKPSQTDLDKIPYMKYEHGKDLRREGISYGPWHGYRWILEEIEVIENG